MTPLAGGAVVRTPYELLGTRPDQTQPFLTSYDGADSCTELSVTTTRNALAKAAGLLRDELGLAPGDRLSIDLPVHWQLAVWTLAGLTAGLVVGARVAQHVEARLLGPDALPALADGEAPRADEVLASSCDAFGMPVRGGVPAGVIDVGIAARAHPDVFQVEPGAAQQAGLLLPAGPDASTLASPGVLQVVGWPTILATRLEDPTAARSWVSEERSATGGAGSAELLRRAAVDPLLRGGSVVLARHVTSADAERLRVLQGATWDQRL